jgi:hypothetical protein
MVRESFSVTKLTESVYRIFTIVLSAVMGLDFGFVAPTMQVASKLFFGARLRKS